MESLMKNGIFTQFLISTSQNTYYYKGGKITFTIESLTDTTSIEGIKMKFSYGTNWDQVPTDRIKWEKKKKAAPFPTKGT